MGSNKHRRLGALAAPRGPGARLPGKEAYPGGVREIPMLSMFLQRLHQHHYFPPIRVSLPPFTPSPCLPPSHPSPRLPPHPVPHLSPTRTMRTELELKLIDNLVKASPDLTLHLPM